MAQSITNNHNNYNNSNSSNNKFVSDYNNKNNINDNDNNIIINVIDPSIEKQTRKRPSPISVTIAALEKLALLIEACRQTRPETIGIKIKVVNKGCGGQKYKMEFAEVLSPQDELVEIPYEGALIKIFLDPKTLFIILGTEIDYITDKFETGFSFKNPKEKGRCGCGESFYV